MATPSQTNDSADEKLSVALLNINGLRNNIHDVQHIIARDKLHVVALCETKLDDSVKDSRVYIPGFRMWRRDRTNKRGGGVALYVQDHIKTKLREDLIKTEVEIIWVEMKLPDSRPVLLGCCYRRPAAKAEYLNQIHEMMTQVSRENKDIFLMGDFNIDWNSDSEKNKTADVISSLGWTQIVKDATRVERGSNRCIDHIYTNIPDRCSKPKSSATDCSDHHLITITVSRKIPKRTRRSKQLQKFELRSSMKWALLTDFCKESDPKKALDSFTEIYLSEAEKHSPLENQDIFDSLKLDDDIQKLISETVEAENERNQDKREASELDRAKQETGIKPFKDQISAKQKTQHQKEVEENKNDPKQLLKVFEEFLGKSLPFCVINITQDGAVASEAEQMENLHRTNTGSADLESVIKGSHVQYIKKRRTDGFNFGTIDGKTVKRLLLHLCHHVTRGIDETEAELMKLAADHISAPIGHILNSCIITGEIPDELKKIKTFPFSGNNYIYSRPDCRNDSVHIMLGYIFDIFLYLQAKQFLTVNNLIPSLTLRDEIKKIETAWLTASEANQTVGAAFLDFSSAFNTISHDLLINKLRTSGFSDSALKLIESFLSCHEGSSGLPRGSFLAELLFIVFISDLKEELTKPAVICNSYMMIYAHGDSQTLETELYHEMISVCGWVQQFDVTFDETRPEPVKPTMMSDVWQILESLSRCHGDELNWIRALKDIVQHCGVWNNPKIRETLEQYFGKKCLDSVPADVMESAINSLLLSRPDLRLLRI